MIELNEALMIELYYAMGVFEQARLVNRVYYWGDMLVCDKEQLWFIQDRCKKFLGYSE